MNLGNIPTVKAARSVSDSFNFSKIEPYLEAIEEGIVTAMNAGKYETTVVLKNIEYARTTTIKEALEGYGYSVVAANGSVNHTLLISWL